MDVGQDSPKKGIDWLVVVLVVLGVAIVGLAAGLIVVNMPKTIPKPGSTPSVSKDPLPSKHTEALEEINNKAEEMEFDEAKALYEKVISEASSDLEKSQARVEYGKFLLYNDMTESAISQFNKVDDSILDDGYKILFYAGMRDYYSSIDDETLYEEYNNKLGEVITNSDYAVGG